MITPNWMLQEMLDEWNRGCKQVVIGKARQLTYQEIQFFLFFEKGYSEKKANDVAMKMKGLK